MLPKLIINADDFGWDDSACEAILELASRNAITSTTIMANLVKKNYLEDLKKIKHLSKGLHLNLIEGKPISNPENIKSILNSKGNFFSSSELFKRYLSGQVKSKDIITETQAQIEHLRSFGIMVSHADSHQHIHVYPFIGADIAKAFHQSGIKKVRRVNVPYFMDKRRFILKLFYFSSTQHFKKFQSPTSLLSDFSIHKNANEKILIESLDKATGVTEMMVHPATSQREGSYLNRKSEYMYLRTGNHKIIAAEKHIELISYSEV